METRELIKSLRDMLPPKVDYADLVGAEGFARGHMYVWEDPEPYFIEEAINTIEKLSEENKQLRNDLIMQTTLVQNGQSAIETNKQLAKRLNAAVEDIKKAIDSDDICSFCKYNTPCQGEKCDQYIEGKGMKLEKTGQYIDKKWTCMDFDYGTCPKLEYGSCNRCFENNMKGFKWRGVQCE